MKIVLLSWLFTFFIKSANAQDLIEPLGDGCPDLFGASSEPFEILMRYIQCSGQFIYDIALGFCVLWVVIGGVQIIISGDNTEWLNRGKSIIFASIGGLMTLLLAPVILRFLNVSFYT